MMVASLSIAIGQQPVRAGSERVERANCQDPSSSTAPTATVIARRLFTLSTEFFDEIRMKSNDDKLGGFFKRFIHFFSAGDCDAIGLER